MAFLSGNELFCRANRALLITMVGGGLMACAVGASIYDIAEWFDLW